MSLLPAENTGHFVPVEIVAWIVVSPLLLSLVVPVVVLRPDVLVSLLASILLILEEELLLAVLGDCVHTVFFLFLLDSLDSGCVSGLIFGTELDSSQMSSCVQVQCVHGLQVDEHELLLDNPIFEAGLMHI